MSKLLRSGGAGLAVILGWSLEGTAQKVQLMIFSATNSPSDFEWAGDWIEDVVARDIWPFLLGAAIASVVLSSVSRIPAQRGHLSALILAAPPIFIGGYALVMEACFIARDAAEVLALRVTNPLLIIVTFSIPLLIACRSVRLWAVQRRSRKGHPPTTA